MGGPTEEYTGDVVLYLDRRPGLVGPLVTAALRHEPEDFVVAQH